MILSDVGLTSLHFSYCVLSVSDVYVQYCVCLYAHPASRCIRVYVDCVAQMDSALLFPAFLCFSLMCFYSDYNKL